MAVSAVYGVSRLIAGYALWRMLKIGSAFGAALSVATLVTAPSIYPFGVMDAVFTVIVLLLILYAWFGYEKLS